MILLGLSLVGCARFIFFVDGTCIRAGHRRFVVLDLVEEIGEFCGDGSDVFDGGSLELSRGVGTSSMFAVLWVFFLYL